MALCLLLAPGNHNKDKQERVDPLGMEEKGESAAPSLGGPELSKATEHHHEGSFKSHRLISVQFWGPRCQQAWIGYPSWSLERILPQQSLPSVFCQQLFLV